jgi:tRNA 2-thiouridine synthesizing protein A
VEHYLDAKGLKCPLPVLRAKKAMRAVPPGGMLTVEATDPAAPDDFRAFCDATGHSFVSLQESSGVYRIEMRRALPE